MADSATNDLALYGVIGFNGTVPNGLILHPGDEHIIYPLGSSIVIKHLVEDTQTFLQTGGHTNDVCCLAISSSGKYLASGEKAPMGFKADVLIWNLETYEVVHRLELHRGMVQDLHFSDDEEFLVTLGGTDDNKIVVWRVEEGTPVSGAQGASDTCFTVRWMPEECWSSFPIIVSGGVGNLRVWEFDVVNRKLRPADCQLGQLGRTTRCVVPSSDGTHIFCGTDSGDILMVSLGPKLFRKNGPTKKEKKFSQGIRCMAKTLDGNRLIIGSGDGTVALVRATTDDRPFKIEKTLAIKVEGSVTSIQLNAAGDHFFVGTSKCNTYLVHVDTFEYELRSTCHNSKINSVCFPRDYSELFATCSNNDIRVWHAQTRNELLRIQVPTLECYSVIFSPDGRSIISGWNDGKIRAFKPQSGKLLYVINDAHRDGVTALAVTSDCTRIISGGKSGIVRVWMVQGKQTRMLATMKEHKTEVNSVRLIETDDADMPPKCISASADGSCIIWNLVTYRRDTAMLATTQFKDVLALPDGSQVLTCGTDRKLTYWDAQESNPIRIIDEGADSTINCLALSAELEGESLKFVSAGEDKVVHVWGYDAGFRYFSGVGHSGSILKVAISPDQEMIVSVGDEGAIFLWEMPPKLPDEEEEGVGGEGY